MAGARAWALVALCGLGALAACGDGDKRPRAEPDAGNAGQGASEGLAGEGATAGALGVAAGAGYGSRPGVGGGGDGGSLSRAGQAGAGGDTTLPPDPCLPSAVTNAFCDDGNPCTVDVCSADGSCAHAALADDASCDDGDICTTADRCVAGACSGAARDERARLLGSTRSFGGFAEGGAAYQGLGAILSDETLVFAEPLQPGIALRLVARSGDELRLIDEIITQAPLKFDYSGFLGDAMLGTHLVALGPTRLALVSTGYAIEVFDVVNDALVRRDTKWLGHTDFVTGAVGFDGHLFACGDGLESYAVDGDGKVVLAARIPFIWPCRALALLPDHSQLYMATTRDVRTFRLQDPLRPERTEVIGRPGHYYAGVAASASGQLALQEDVVLETAGAASVLNSADFSEQHVFTSSYRQLVPYGVGFLGNEVIVQRERVSDGIVTLSLEAFAVETAAAVPRGSYTFASYADAVSERVQVYPLITHGSLAIVAPTRHVLRADGGSISELRGVAQGQLSRVVPAGTGRVAAYSSGSTHLIDISAAGSPKLLAGGLLEPGAGGPLSFQAAGPDAPASWLGFGASSKVVPKAPATAQIVQFEQLGDGTPQPVGDLNIEGGPAARAVSSGLLFELRSAEPGQAYLLRSYALPGERMHGERLEPFAEQGLSTEDLVSPGFAIDVAGNALVLAGRSTKDQTIVTARWFERVDGTWQAAAALDLPTDLTTTNNSDFVAVREGFAIVVSEANRRLHVVERTSEGMQVVATREFSPDIGAEPNEERTFSALLGFDGDRVYLSGSYRDEEYVRHARAFAFLVPTLELVAEYELPEDVMSMTTSGGKLVFGMASHLSVALPECRGG